MTREIDGFIIDPHTPDTIMAQRVAEPQHEYRFEYAPDGVKLLETVPAAVADGDPSEDANRFEGEATAKKYWDQLFAAIAY